jgi:hypothetical protein
MKPVFWILGSVLLATDPDPDADPTFFVIKKLFFSFFQCFLCLFLFEGTLHLHHSSKIKSHKTLEIKAFLNFFAY